MHSCKMCQQKSVDLLLDFGNQPISNRFLTKQTTTEFSHSLLLGYCRKCSLIQLVDPVPSEEVIPRFNWIKYNEPENHLDEVAEIISNLPGINTQSSFCGVSDKEDSLLKRLSKKGFSQTWTLSRQEDLGINNPNAGIESIQAALDVSRAEEVIKNKGSPNVIIARHILEHAHNPLQFMQALSSLVHEEGYIVYELPDCTKLLDTYEYSAIWEEHTLYFTPYSFLKMLRQAGLYLQLFKIYPYSMENCIVAVVKVKNLTSNQATIDLSPYDSTVDREEDRIFNFSKKFKEKCNWYQEKISQHRLKGPITLLGAGHLATHFINLMGLRSLFDFVVDDHPDKQGLFMPGSQLPILPSSALDEKKIKTCFLSLNQESEDKVIKHKQKFTEQGGQFFSIFSTSKYAMV